MSGPHLNHIREALALVEAFLAKKTLARAQRAAARLAAKHLRALLQHTERREHMTPKEVAELMMVSPVTVRQWAAKGLLHALITPGGHRRFPTDRVEDFARKVGVLS